MMRSAVAELAHAALVHRHLKEARNAYDTQHKLHTFSIGVPGSRDLINARKVGCLDAS